MEKNKKGTIWISGILITLLLLAMGFLFDSVLGQFTLFKPLWPQNLYFFLVLLIMGMAIGVITDKLFIKQLASFGALLPSMVLSLIIGGVLIIDPLSNKLAYFSYLTGLPAFFLLIYVVLVSGISMSIVIKKYQGLNKMIPIFPLLGYLVFVMATIAGQNDYYHMKMVIGNDRAIFEGKNHDGRILRTPFALKLLNLELPIKELEFALRENNPEGMNILESAPFLQSGSVALGKMKVDVEAYLPKATGSVNGFEARDTSISVQAAQIKISNTDGILINEGWVSTGSAGNMPLSLDVDESLKVSLLYSQKQSYIAQIRVFDTVSKYEDHSLSPSQHHSFKGWKISVDGFDPRFGEDSAMVEMDLVFDRWFETKYIGLVIMLLGLLGLLKLKK
ncbi:hypothetical protein [Carboxylicivirga caseinilyticus]|uniref:hypothetical protein n=1 Tax=Carboxylicivirga caseinilyticus TaxID=3417572 RepID=UPI003D338CED|nr:hypothetical protein [Marinilabiliaceae bacterium A049]